jgi:CubicO group peptidase (beta-lactamase class C family)
VRFGRATPSARRVTKSVTAAVAVRLSGEGRLALDAPLADQLAPELLHRWRALDGLPRTTVRQLLAHTAGVPNYFGEDAFMARLREGRAWRPVELVDHAAAHGTPPFPPGQGFQSSDSGYVTDWAGGRLVTTASDLGRFVRALSSGRIVDFAALGELTRWTPGASFPPGHMLRYDRYGLGMGSVTVEGLELVGHTGFIGAFAFQAPAYDAVLVGTHNASHVDRWPLVAVLCRELREAA